MCCDVLWCILYYGAHRVVVHVVLYVAFGVMCCMIFCDVWCVVMHVVMWRLVWCGACCVVIPVVDALLWCILLCRGVCRAVVHDVLWRLLWCGACCAVIYDVLWYLLLVLTTSHMNRLGTGTCHASRIYEVLRCMCCGPFCTFTYIIQSHTVSLLMSDIYTYTIYVSVIPITIYSMISVHLFLHIISKYSSIQWSMNTCCTNLSITQTCVIVFMYSCVILLFKLFDFEHSNQYT